MKVRCGKCGAFNIIDEDDEYYVCKECGSTRKVPYIKHDDYEDDEGSSLVGFLLGFFLGEIGLIIAAFMGEKKTIKAAAITVLVQILLGVLVVLIVVLVMGVDAVMAGLYYI